jgi:hypothetical protein
MIVRYALPAIAVLALGAAPALAAPTHAKPAAAAAKSASAPTTKTSGKEVHKKKH